MARYYGVTKNDAHTIAQNPSRLYNIAQTMTVFDSPEAAVHSIQNMPADKGIGQLYTIFEFDGEGLVAQRGSTPNEAAQYPFAIATDSVRETGLVMQSGVIHGTQVIGITEGKPEADGKEMRALVNMVKLRDKGLQVFELACKDMPEIPHEAMQEWGKLAAQDSEPSASYMYYKVFAEAYTFVMNNATKLGISNSAQQIAKLAMYTAACEAAKQKEDNNPYARHVQQTQDAMRTMQHALYVEEMNEIAGITPETGFNVVEFPEGEFIGIDLTGVNSFEDLVALVQPETIQLAEPESPLALPGADDIEYDAIGE